MIRDAAWALLVYGAFLLGIATTIVYVVRRKRVRIETLPSVVPVAAKRAVYRSELPTLTNIQIPKEVLELAKGEERT